MNIHKVSEPWVDAKDCRGDNRGEPRSTDSSEVSILTSMIKTSLDREIEKKNFRYISSELMQCEIS